MTKQELVTDMRRHCEGSAFINRTELAAFMGYTSPKRVDRFLEGLDRIAGTRYFINDVAANILKYRG